jgi:hypothetical protein
MVLYTCPTDFSLAASASLPQIFRWLNYVAIICIDITHSTQSSRTRERKDVRYEKVVNSFECSGSACSIQRTARGWVPARVASDCSEMGKRCPQPCFVLILQGDNRWPVGPGGLMARIFVANIGVP